MEAEWRLSGGWVEAEWRLKVEAEGWKLKVGY